MIGQYDRIEKVKYNDGSDTYLLTGDGIGSDLEVDLKSDCFFNTEFDVIDRELVTTVSSLEEFIIYAEEMGISLNIDNIPIEGDTKVVLVGGEKDMAITSDMSFDWVENLLDSKDY